jgi:hypothetical protein
VQTPHGGGNSCFSRSPALPPSSTYPLGVLLMGALVVGLVAWHVAALLGQKRGTVADG